MKTYVVGDIHGAAKGLKQALERSPIGKDDLLITLGDIADGWSHVDECIDILLKYPNRIDIIGNHDKWVHEWIKTGIHPDRWRQGGLGTLKSFQKVVTYDIEIQKLITHVRTRPAYTTNLLPKDLPERYIDFFQDQLPYYVQDNMCFVHGGFNRHFHIDEQDPNILMWDRDLFMSALSDMSRRESDQIDYPFKIQDDFDKVFIGHTTTIQWKTDQPIITNKVINVDTGGGYAGRITVMDVDTLEYWQSDPVQELYPNEKGR